MGKKHTGERRLARQISSRRYNEKKKTYKEDRLSSFRTLWRNVSLDSPNRAFGLEILNKVSEMKECTEFCPII